MIRVSPQMIEEILAIEIRFRHASVTLVQKSEVTVDINQRRNDGLAGQIDTNRTWRRLNLALSANRRETIVLDDKSGAFNWCAAIAHDQPRTFEYNGRIALRQAH